MYENTFTEIASVIVTYNDNDSVTLVTKYMLICELTITEAALFASLINRYMKDDIIIFGDSFATNKHNFAQNVSEAKKKEISAFSSITNNWTKQLASILELNEVNYAEEGSAIDYSVSKLYEHISSNNCSNATCVFLLTNPVRKYLSTKYKNNGFVVKHKIPTDMPSEVINWIIDNEPFSIAQSREINTICMLKNIASKFKRVVLINCFETIDDKFIEFIDTSNTEHFSYVQGALVTVSKDEVIDLSIDHGDIDNRPNHLTDENHAILAKCIADVVINNTSVNLQEIEFVNDCY